VELLVLLRTQCQCQVVSLVLLVVVLLRNVQEVTSPVVKLFFSLGIKISPQEERSATKGFKDGYICCVPGCIVTQITAELSYIS